jgi:hypothetical protein
MLTTPFQINPIVDSSCHRPVEQAAQQPRRRINRAASYTTGNVQKQSSPFAKHGEMAYAKTRRKDNI